MRRPTKLGRLRYDSRFLPFADAASADLPLSRLLRLSLFQVSVGIALALLNGTLNRVMIVELNVPAWLVATMIGLPLLFARCAPSWASIPTSIARYSVGAACPTSGSARFCSTVAWRSCPLRCSC